MAINNNCIGMILTILMSFLILNVQGQTSHYFRQQSFVYIVKFTKATPQEIRKAQQGDQVLDQIKFLQKLVGNATDVVTKAVFYVNYTIQIPILKLSNNNDYSNTNINNNANINNNNLRTSNPSSSNIDSIVTSERLINNQLATNNQAVKLPSSLNVSKSSTMSQVQQTQVSQTLTSSSEIQYPQPRPPYLHIKQPKLIISPYSSSSSSPSLPPSSSIPSLDTQFAPGGIGLTNQTPKNFIKNQIYHFNGTIIDQSVIQNLRKVQYSDSTYITFTISRIEGEEEVKCSQKVYKDKVWFSINCKLEIQGPVFFGVSIGDMPGFSSKIIRRIYEKFNPISISDNIPTQPKGLYLAITDDLFINWQSKSALTKIVFNQPATNQSVEFLLSNYQNSFRVPYHAFKNFQQQLTTVFISHANSRDRTLYGMSTFFGNIMYFTFKAAQHLTIMNLNHYYKFASQLPMKVYPNKTYTFNVTFRTRIQNEIFLVSPYNQIKKVYFKNQLRKKGTSGVSAGVIEVGQIVQLKVSFQTIGANLIEINEDSGMAIINQPVYVGDIYPLLPDYIDLKVNAVAQKQDPIPILQNYFLSSHPRKVTISQPSKNSSSLAQKQDYLFTLVNLLRTRQIVNPVYLDEKLTSLAQDHTDDMKKNSYFSHNNLYGEGAGQRAKKKQFYGAIGENVALSNSLIQAHLSLERSATHLENSLNWVWTRVGIGISINSFGQYIIAYQFSSRDIKIDPLTKKQLQRHQSQLTSLAMSKLPQDITQNPLASIYIQDWLKSSRNLSLTNYIYSRGIRKQMLISTITFGYYPKIINEIDKSPDFFKNVTDVNERRKISSFGVNLAPTQYDETLIQCYFVYFYK